jgi:hypothetical protein
VVAFASFDFTFQSEDVVHVGSKEQQACCY